MQEPRRDARPLTQLVSPVEAELATDQSRYGGFQSQGSQNRISPMPRLRDDRLLSKDAQPRPENVSRRLFASPDHLYSRRSMSQLHIDIVRGDMFTSHLPRYSSGVVAQASANMGQIRLTDEGARNLVRSTSTIEIIGPQPAAVHGDNASVQLDGVSRETNVGPSL